MKGFYAMLVAASCVGAIHAETFTFESSSLGLTYELDTETKTAVVTEGKNAKGRLEIPKEVNYESTNSKNGVYKTIGIGDQAFANNGNLTQVVLPDGIEYIGDEAFRSCSQLNYVYLPNGVQTIGSNSFNSTGILELVMPETIVNFDNAFGISQNSVKLIFAITNLDKWLTTPTVGMATCVDMNPMFTYSYQLNGTEIKNLLIPMGVERIKDYAFYGSTSIQSVTFPDSMKSIGDFAFSSIEGLSNVNLNEGILSIGAESFSNCENIESISLSEGLSSIGNRAFANNTALFTVTIPSTVNTLGVGIFDGCTDLEKVTLPEGILSVPEKAFYGCKRLSNINIPKNVKTIGDEAFYGTTSLLDVKLPEGLREIGVKAFMIDFDDNYARFEINLPEGLETIGEKALGCRGVRYLTLPSTLKNIGSCAFGMTRVMELNIPASVTILGEKALAACPFLTKVTLPSTLKEIGVSAFESSTISSISIPESVTIIHDRAFAQTNLTNITIPDGVTTLGVLVLDDIVDLAFVQIGKGVTSLENPLGAPNSCVLKLGSTTPPTLTTDRLGFEPSLVIVPNGAEKAYLASNRWKNYNIAGENSSRVDVYVNTPGTLATEIRVQTGKMPAEVTNLNVEGTLNDADFATIRSNMTSCYDVNLSKITNTVIPEKAFFGKKNLINLTLPSKLKTINDDAFAGCTVMHLSELPETLTAIGDRAFQNCLSMNNDLIAPKTLSVIGMNAFENCKNLKSVDLSVASIKTLPEQVFAYCENLETVQLPDGIAEIPNGAFRNTGISNIVLPTGISSIGDFAFTQCPHLGKIIIPEGTEIIGLGAFLYSGLRAIELPESLKQISQSAFQYSLLNYISFPDGLTELNPNVVANCSELLVVNLPSQLEAIFEGAINSASLSAINSPALSPATCLLGSPFAEVDNYSCALSIPKQSYTPYLLAEYWGSFIGIRNCIDVTISENLNVTYMPEIDYQDMLEDMRTSNPSNMRRRALRSMRENDIVDVNKGYGKLFNGASLYREDNSEMRIFIDVDPNDCQSLKVEYDGVDYTSKFDINTKSVLIPGGNFSAPLDIILKKSGINDIDTDNDYYGENGADVYTILGIKVLSKASKADVEALPEGLYIVNGRKIAVRK